MLTCDSPADATERRNPPRNPSDPPSYSHEKVIPTLASTLLIILLQPLSFRRSKSPTECSSLGHIIPRHDDLVHGRSAGFAENWETGIEGDSIVFHLLLLNGTVSAVRSSVEGTRGRTGLSDPSSFGKLARRLIWIC